MTSLDSVVSESVTCIEVSIVCFSGCEVCLEKEAHDVVAKNKQAKSNPDSLN